MTVADNGAACEEITAGGAAPGAGRRFLLHQLGRGRAGSGQAHGDQSLSDKSLPLLAESFAARRLPALQRDSARRDLPSSTEVQAGAAEVQEGDRELGN